MEQARSNLKVQIGEVRRATLAGDHAALAELTHPAAVTGIGGKDAFVRYLERESSDMRKKGFSYTDVAYDEPTQIVESSGKLFTIFPFTLYLTAPDGAKGRIKYYLIGMSNDQGRKWVFLDGNGINDDRKKLQSIMPDFPDSLTLPNQEAPVWN